MPVPKSPQLAAVATCIRNTISKNGGSADWAAIAADAKAEFRVSNFLTQVRGPLQAMLDTGEIRRRSDVTVEVYEFPLDEVPTHRMLINIRQLQSIQMTNPPSSDAWRAASAKLQPMFAEMARRQKLGEETTL